MRLEKDEIVTLTPLHHLEVKEVDGEYLTFVFNSNFYCIYGHDNEVSCNGFLFYGSSKVMKLALSAGQSSNPKIHAIGDVKGGLQFTYISLDDYRILREDLFGAGERKVSDRDPVSYSVFIDPPLSRIGLSEAEARKKGLNIKVNKLSVAAIPRARTLGDTNGLFKVVVDADTDKILGCTLFGPESSEVINLVAMAMKTGQEYTFLRDFVFTHPSMSEALNDLMGF